MKNDPIVVQVDFTIIDCLITDEAPSAAARNYKFVTYQDSSTGVILHYGLVHMSPDGLSETDEDGALPK